MPLQPSIAKSTPIVNKRMPIRDQIRAQENKKGKKHYMIDTEGQVEWFIKTYVAPELSKKSYL